MSSIREEMINKIISDFVIGMRDALNEQTQNCTNCGHFDERTENCILYKARPPASIIVSGCDSYQEDDGIPF